MVWAAHENLRSACLFLFFALRQLYDALYLEFANLHTSPRITKIITKEMNNEMPFHTRLWTPVFLVVMSYKLTIVCSRYGLSFMMSFPHLGILHLNKHFEGSCELEYLYYYTDFHWEFFLPLNLVIGFAEIVQSCVTRNILVQICRK